MEKAVLSLAASAMSPIFSSLADKGASYFGGDITEEDLSKLQSVIPKIRAAIDLAEGIHVDHVHKLKEGLMRLRASAYEADDVLDMYEYKRLKAQVKRLKAQHRVSSQPSGSIQTLLSGKAKNLFGPIKLKTKLKRRMEGLLKTALEEAEKLISVAGDISKAAPTQVNQHQPPPTSVSTPPPQVLVLGRDGERDFLVDVLISSLLPARLHVPVVAIHGIGGAGKTTLAQLVYNDPRVAQHFDNNMMMWVHVSNHFDVRTVTREIIESVTGDGNHNNLNNLDALQKKLKNVLKSKRFLLVLDDVWCDDKVKWDQMLIPLNENGGDMGSRILVTTRTQEVASKLGVDRSIPLKELQSTDYWSIFKHYAFGDANKGIDDPALLEVAEQIVKKLSKSPLAARMVGSLLNRRNMSTADSWKMILKQQDMLNDTFDALLLSFQHLPLPLQQCFAFCSLYPKGHEFDDNDLIRLWIAQGFVDAHDMNNMTIEEKGQQYFKDLVAHSFFQETNLYSTIYVIHDLLHDLAEKVSKGHCFRIEGDEAISIPSTILHLSISTPKLSIHIPNILKLVNLRTFINLLVSSNSDTYDVDFNDVVIAKNNMFKKLTKLRVFDAGSYDMGSYPKLAVHSSIGELTKLRVFDAGSYSMGSYPKLEVHSSIGELKHLRLLKLRQNNVKKLPESIATLYHLQYVIMLGFGSIDMVLPKDFHKLINLRFLESGDDMFSRIQLFGHLTSLQQLREYHATRNKNCEIGQLKNLQELHGSLTICDLQNVKDKTEAAEASLEDKRYLDELQLEWSHGVGRDGSMDQEVLEGLKPPPNLKFLDINGYLGVGSPRWMLNISKSLSKLHTLYLSACTKLCTVPPLGQLPLLTRLYLSSMPLVKEIGPDFYGGDDGELGGVRFPRLEILQFLSMNNWMHWYGAADGVQLFPRLRRLSIKYCPNLVQIPSLPPTLQKLHIDDCQNLSIVCGPLPQSLTFLQMEKCPKLMQMSPFLCHGEEMKMEGLPAGVEDMLMPQQQQLAKEKVDSENYSLVSVSVSVSVSEEKKMFKCPNGFTSLSRLLLVGLPCLTPVLLVPNLPALEFLRIEECENLESIGSSLSSIPSLKKLEISSCSHLRSLLEQSDLRSLEDLMVDGCPELTSLGNSQSLSELSVRRCPRLEIGGGGGKSTAACCHFPSLRILTTDDISILAPLVHSQGLSNSLRVLKIRDCTQDTGFTPEQEKLFQKLTSLDILSFELCPNLPSLPVTLKNLTSLWSLQLRECPKIESLPKLSASLVELNISCGCHEQLRVKYGKDGPLRHTINHIPSIYI